MVVLRGARDLCGGLGSMRAPFSAVQYIQAAIEMRHPRFRAPTTNRLFIYFILFLWSADPSIRAREKRNGARDADLCIFRRSNCRAEAIGCAYSGDRAAARQYCVCVPPLMCFSCAPDGQVTVAKSASVRPGQNFVTSWAFFSFAGKPVIDRGNR